MKSVWQSKTFWVNVIAIAGLFAQSLFGLDTVPMEYQAMALGAVNLILRAITKTEIIW